MSYDELSGARWRKSSRSGGENNSCVEVALGAPKVVGIRDTKDREGGTIILPQGSFDALLRCITTE